MHSIVFVLGTRPEAIKLCPLLLHLRRASDEFDVRLCVTAQHRQMLDQVLAAFAVKPDYDLNCMRPGHQSTGPKRSRMRPWRMKFPALSR